MDNQLEKFDIAVLGGGLAGLSAAYVLSGAGRKVAVVEKESEPGGLARTIVHGGFRFDIGGHRFFTTNTKIDALVRGLLGDEMVTVSRKSKIFLRDKYFDYPLRPLNALGGLGIPTTVKIISDYGWERLKALRGNGKCVSLEDWVVGNFGRTMFNIYFKEYSEKVWGVDCSRISRSWVAERIKGLSLGKALKNAFFKFSGKKIPTLADRFIYPKKGIGRISDKLAEGIDGKGSVMTDTHVVGLEHRDGVVRNIEVRGPGGNFNIEAGGVISTIPLTALIRMLRPAPPDDVLESVGMLKYRDIVIVAVMVAKERATDQTWIYIPERKYPIGRIHEPKNWSEDMAPKDKTLLVVEYFCFEGDGIWSSGDTELVDLTVENLGRLGFIEKHEAEGGVVVRAPKAYPLFEVGYEQHVEKLYSYLSGLRNLYIAGRSGMFKYYNMDHAMEAGVEAAEGFLAPADAPESVLS